MSDCVYKYLEHKDNHISISASAGTGKTYTITKIIEQFASNNIDLSRVAVITYTEKAASELKVRIRKALEKLREYDTSQIENIQIGTIHQFCRNILSTEVIYLSYSYDYTEIRDEYEVKNQAFENFWDKIEFKYENELYILLRYVPYKEFKEKILAIASKVRNYPISEIDCEKEEVLIKKFKTILNDLYLPFENFLKQHPKDNLEGYRAKESNFDLDDIVDITHIFDIIYRNGKGEFYKSYFKKEKKEEDKKIIENLQEFDEKIGNFFLSKIIKFSNLFIKFYYKFLLENDQLPTTDLIFETKKILEKKSDISHEISQRYIFTIIDESQDTNHEQIEIFKHIYQKHSRGIILVGDSKQSIYRFQGADLNSYKRGEEIFQTKLLSLNETRRSSKILTNGINILTQSLFKNDNRISYEKVLSRRDCNNLEQENSPPIQLVECDSLNLKDNKSPSADEKINLQVYGITNWILEAVNNEKFKIFDKNTWRTINFSDIVILTSKNNNPELKDALVRENIPFYNPDNRKVLDESIIKAISCLLSSIENPNNTKDLFLCLESILFNIQREELLNETSISYLKESSNIRIKKIYKTLRWAYYNRYSVQSGNLVYQVLEKTKLLNIYLLEYMG